MAPESENMCGQCPSFEKAIEKSKPKNDLDHSIIVSIDSSEPVPVPSKYTLSDVIQKKKQRCLFQSFIMNTISPELRDKMQFIAILVCYHLVGILLGACILFYDTNMITIVGFVLSVSLITLHGILCIFLFGGTTSVPAEGISLGFNGAGPLNRDILPNGSIVP